MFNLSFRNFYFKSDFKICGFIPGDRRSNHKLELFDQISPQLCAQSIHTILAQPFSGKPNEVYIWIFGFEIFENFILKTTMSKRKANFPPRVPLSHKKLRYQEGEEDDVQFLCANGTLTVSNILVNTKQ